MYYILFCRYKDSEGGARDFHSSHTDLEAAKRAGIAMWENDDAYWSSWMDLAAFDGQTMRVISTLNIPGTERDEMGMLKWIDESAPQ